MKIYDFQLGSIETNVYVILPDAGNGAIVVDAAEDTAEVVGEFLEKNNRKLSAILVTHAHWDHIWDAAKLAKKWHAPVYSHADSSPFMEIEGAQDKYMFDSRSLESVKIDVFVEDGQVLDIDGVKIKCFTVPGHLDGSVMYVLEDQFPIKAFVGDVIFEGGIGRYDLPTGSFARLEKSIREKIYTLPDDTVLLTGHGPSTTVGAEKKSNPYVRA